MRDIIIGHYKQCAAIYFLIYNNCSLYVIKYYKKTFTADKAEGRAKVF